MYIPLLSFFLVVVSVQGRESCPSSSSCSSKDAAILVPHNPDQNAGYFYLGGMFGVHELSKSAYKCGKIRERGIQNLEMFFYALNTYKQKFGNSALGKIQVGGIAFDSCSRVAQTLEKLMSFEKCAVAYQQDLQPKSRLDPRDVLAYVGPDRSGEALATAALLNDMKKVQISHAATTAALNQKDKYEYFLRTAYSNDNEVRGLLTIMENLSFKFSLVVYSNNVYGKQMHDVFTAEAHNYQVCVVLSVALPLSVTDQAYDAIIEQLLEYREVYSLAVLANDFYAAAFLKSLGKSSRKQAFTIFGVNSWGEKMSVIEGSNGAAEGAITVAMLPSDLVDIDGFKSHFRSLNPNINKHNPWFGEYWESVFECDLGVNTKYNKKCDLSKQKDLNAGPKIQFDVFLPNTMLAVEAAVSGIAKAIKDTCSQTTVCATFLNAPNIGDEIYKKVIQVKSNNKAVFNHTTGGTANWEYQIYNVVSSKYKKVGKYTKEGGLSLVAKILNSRRDPHSDGSSSCPVNKICCGRAYTTAVTTSVKPTVVASLDPTHKGKYTAVYVANDTHLTGITRTQPRAAGDYKTRFDLGQNWIIALGVVAGLGIAIVVVLEIYIMYKVVPDRETRQLRSMWLGQLLIFGICLSYLTLFAYIPEPTDATCTITRLGVGMSYAICFSVLLVKLMVIITSRPSENYAGTDGGNYLKGSYQFLMFVFAVGVQLVIDVQWLISVPPEAVKVKTRNNEDAWICNHYTWSAAAGYEDMKSFVRTEFENHVISLVYVMFLIFLTAVIALKSHGIITNHKESVFIGLSAGFAIPIWIAWTLLAHFNHDDNFAHQYGDACIAFGLFLTATLILMAMFLPKVRQLNSMGIEGIYLEDDVDTVYGANTSMYGGIPPSYRSKAGPGSVVYMTDQGIYSEPVIANGDPRSNHLKYPKTSHSVHSMPAYGRRPESTYTNGGGTMKMVTVTPDLTGKYRMTQSEFGTTKSNKSYKSSTMKRARSTQDIGSL